MSYPHSYIKLTNQEKRLVGKYLKKLAYEGNSKKRIHLQIIWLSSKWVSFNVIAQRLSLSYPTVRRWIYRYRKEGLSPFIPT